MKTKEAKNVLGDEELNVIDKKDRLTASEMTLTSNEIKDTIKVIRSLKNRMSLLKGTTRKIPSQKVGFLNFLRPLMSVNLPLIKNVLTPLAKNVLVPLGLTKAASATNAAIQKKIFGSGKTASAILNEGRYYENSSIF